MRRTDACKKKRRVTSLLDWTSMNSTCQFHDMMHVGAMTSTTLLVPGTTPLLLEDGIMEATENAKVRAAASAAEGVESYAEQIAAQQVKETAKVRQGSIEAQASESATAKTEATADGDRRMTVGQTATSQATAKSEQLESVATEGEGSATRTGVASGTAEVSATAESTGIASARGEAKVSAKRRFGAQTLLGDTLGMTLLEGTLGMTRLGDTLGMTLLAWHSWEDTLEKTLLA
eukprot:s6019_g1.t1